MHWMRRAASRAACTAGKSIAIKTAMIAITTKSSISVKPARRAAHAGLQLPARQLPVHRAIVCDECPCFSLDRIATRGGEPPESGPAPADSLDEVLSPTDSPSQLPAGGAVEAKIADEPVTLQESELTCGKASGPSATARGLKIVLRLDTVWSLDF